MQEQITITDFEPGAYFVELTLENYHTVKKIIKM